MPPCPFRNLPCRSGEIAVKSTEPRSGIIVERKVDRTVAGLNIEHYRKLLRTDLDEQKRRTVEKLLADEEAKLAAIDAKRKQQKLRSGR